MVTPTRIMNEHHKKSPIDILAKLLFPKVGRARRRDNLRSLMLAVSLGLIFCSMLVGILWLMNRRWHL